MCYTYRCREERDSSLQRANFSLVFELMSCYTFDSIGLVSSIKLRVENELHEKKSISYEFSLTNSDSVLNLSISQYSIIRGSL
jgi:hypothetical protein